MVAASQVFAGLTFQLSDRTDRQTMRSHGKISTTNDRDTLKHTVTGRTSADTKQRWRPVAFLFLAVTGVGLIAILVIELWRRRASQLAPKTVPRTPFAPLTVEGLTEAEAAKLLKVDPLELAQDCMVIGLAALAWAFGVHFLWPVIPLYSRVRARMSGNGSEQIAG